MNTVGIYRLALNPAKLHMTVPPDFRCNSDIPAILVLHYPDLHGGEVQTVFRAFKFTRPPAAEP